MTINLLIKKLLFLCTTSIVMVSCVNDRSERQDAQHQHDSSAAPIAMGTSKKSIPSEITNTINGATIKIKYHSPAVRGRVIWGGLVSYDNVWVTGAHSATTIEVSKDFTVGDRTIPSGKYALFTIPSKDEWTIILNKNWDQHLTDEYDEKDDVARVKVKPGATTVIAERLKYEIEPANEKAGNIIISWEKLRVAFQIAVR